MIFFSRPFAHYHQLGRTRTLDWRRWWGAKGRRKSCSDPEAEGVGSPTNFLEEPSF